MGGCSVLHCSNSAKKGFHMLRIPQDAVKRKLWLKAMSRTELEPGVEGRVCEEHFTSEMWELPKNNRKRKLKRDAIPTIFPEPPMKVLHMEKTILGRNKKNASGNYIIVPNINSQRDQGIKIQKVIPENISCLIQQTAEQSLHKKPSVVIVKPQSMNQVSILRKRKDLDSSPEENLDLATTITIIPQIENEVSESFFYPEESTQENLISEHDFINEKSEINDEHSEEFNSEITEDSNGKVENLANPEEAKHQKNIFLPVNEEMMKKIIHKQHKKIIDMEKKLKSLKRQISKRNENSHNVYKKVLEALFSDEQIRALISKYVGGGSGKVYKWSEKTIKAALTLKFSCGNLGYEELLKMGFPFPSQRTLRETMESLNFRTEISDNVVDTFEENSDDLPDETDDQNCMLEFGEMAMTSQDIYDT